MMSPGTWAHWARAIQPAVDSARKQPGDALDNAVRANIALVVAQLKSAAPILEDFFKRGRLTIDGARYDMDEGMVAVLP